MSFTYYIRLILHVENARFQVCGLKVVAKKAEDKNWMILFSSGHVLFYHSFCLLL